MDASSLKCAAGKPYSPVLSLQSSVLHFLIVSGLEIFSQRLFGITAESCTLTHLTSRCCCPPPQLTEHCNATDRAMSLANVSGVIQTACDQPPPSLRPSTGCTASGCRPPCCLASVWCYSDKAWGSRPAAPACLRHSCQSTEDDSKKHDSYLLFPLNVHVHVQQQCPSLKSITKK